MKLLNVRGNAETERERARERKGKEKRERKNPQASKAGGRQVEKYKRDDKRTETRGFIELDEEKGGRRKRRRRRRATRRTELSWRLTEGSECEQERSKYTHART